MQKNYYQILGVARNASPDEISLAYRRAHDRIARSELQDPDTLALLRDAHDTLADGGARASYDQSLDAPPALVRLGTARMAAVDAESDAPEDRRKWVRLAVLLTAILLTILVGLVFMRSPAPRQAPPPEVVNTSTTATTTKTSGASPAPSEPAADGNQNYAKAKARSADQVFADVSASVVRVIVMDGNGTTIGGGSGVVVNGRSTVITNCHVALKGPLVAVKSGKEIYPANVDIADESYDLCQLSVGNGFSAPPVDVGTVKYVRPGQTVYAIGSPQGLDLTISEGIVSSLRETSQGNIIQTTAPISPGSSGGGLFNVNGQLIGITTFQAKTGQNLNFAVPADWIADMVTRGGNGPSLQ